MIEQIAIVVLAFTALFATHLAASRSARAQAYWQKLNSAHVRVQELYQWLHGRPQSYAPLEYLMWHLGMQDQISYSDPCQPRLTNVLELRNWLEKQEQLAPPPGVLRSTELAKCHKNPVVLRALADEHDCSAMEAESIGDMAGPVQFHTERAKELRRLADEIEAAC